MKKNPNLPDWCYVDDSVGGAGIVRNGESGFYPIEQKPGGDPPPKAGDVRKLNEAIGVKPSVAEAMKMASMFGWDVPGANPALYTVLDVVH